MKFKSAYLVIVFLLTVGGLMPVSVFSSEQASTFQLWAGGSDHQSGSLRAWDTDTNGTENSFPNNDGYENPYGFNDGPIADGVLIVIMLALFYGIILQQINKLKNKQINKFV